MTRSNSLIRRLTQLECQLASIRFPASGSFTLTTPSLTKSSTNFWTLALVHLIRTVLDPRAIGLGQCGQQSVRNRRRPKYGLPEVQIG